MEIEVVSTFGCYVECQYECTCTSFHVDMFLTLLIMNLEMKWLSCMVIPCLVFLRHARLLYKAVHLTFPPAVLTFQISIPVSPNSHQYFLFSSCLIITVFLRDANGISLCFWFAFPSLVTLSIFYAHSGHWRSSWENYSNPQSILNWVVDLFIIRL